MDSTLNWGILGAGNISGQFVRDLLEDNDVKAHRVVAVGSLNVEKAADFVKRHIAPKRNNGCAAQSYDDFFRNPEIDIVYIGTPHSFHKAQAIAALESGKHVLCEKPFTVTAAEAREVFGVAKKCGKFAMEAVWTRFLPAVLAARSLVFEGKLGTVHRVTADFSFNADIKSWAKLSRARDINLAAGATLDVGIYLLTYGRLFLDQNGNTPFEVKSFLSLDKEDGVDHLSTILMRYENGSQCVATSSNLVNGPQPFLRVEGDEGVLEMHSENPAGPKYLKVTGKYSSDFKDEGRHIGFIHEANAAAAAIGAGQLECDLMPWHETVLMMETLDKVRHENGLFYKMET